MEEQVPVSAATDTLEARRAQQAQRRSQLNANRRTSTGSGGFGTVHSTVNFANPATSLGSPVNPTQGFSSAFGPQSNLQSSSSMVDVLLTANQNNSNNGGTSGFAASSQRKNSDTDSHHHQRHQSSGGSVDVGGDSSSSGMRDQLAAFGISCQVSDATSSHQQLPSSPSSDLLNLKNSNESLFDSTTSQKELVALCPPRGLLFNQVERVKGGSGTSYYRLFQNGSNNRFLLSARKRQNKQTANYLISVDPADLDRESEHIVGKVRGNFSGTEFVCYDDGVRAEDAETELEVRKELCAVLFEANVAGTKGPRKMVVLLPHRLNEGGGRRKEGGHDEKRGTQLEVWRPATESQGLIAEYKRNRNSDRLIILENKAPTWSEQLRAYQLNFKGRVTKASVKNFQLCERRKLGDSSVSSPESSPTKKDGGGGGGGGPPVLMQFGKREDHEFALDYQYPLDAVQAMSIAITVFDTKMLCE